MDKRLDNLTIAIYSTSRSKCVAVGDGDIEAIQEFKDENISMIQSAIHTALESYKLQVRKKEEG